MEIRLCVLCMIVTSLVTSQNNVLSPLASSLEVFGAAADSATELVEQQLLTLLYPASAQTVQAELDRCEERLLSSEQSQLQTIGTDLQRLAVACASEDPAAPVDQLVEDVLSLFALLVQDCEDLTVDLRSDVVNLVSALVAQGYVQPLPSVLQTLLGSSLPALPLTTGGDFAGVSQSALNATVQNGVALFQDWTNLQSEIQNNGAPTAQDTAVSLNDAWGLALSDSTVWGEVLRAIADYTAPALRTLCESSPQELLSVAKA